MLNNILDKRLEWVIWYNNCTPITMRLPCIKRQSNIRWTNEALEAVITATLPDKRDWSSLVLNFVNHKPQTRFQHLVWNFLKRKERIGSLKTYIPRKRSITMVIDLAIELWSACDTDISQTLIELAEEGSPASWQMIAKAKVNPNSAIYQGNSDLFFRDYIAVSFLRKYEGLTDLCGANPEKAALESWLAAERQCRETNTIFADSSFFSNEERRELFAVKQLVQRILGPSPSIDQVRKGLRIGPGATRSCPSKFCSIFDKIENLKTVSHTSLSMSRTLLKGTFWERELAVSHSSVLATVGKTAIVGRTIEPPEDFDAQAQLSLGGIIKSRLKRFGLDINVQAQQNALLARAGSISGELATIDLASASDTIAYRVIELLLPKGWFNWLARYRSRIVQISDPDGVQPEPIHYRLNKFSAMGNGFTFELETLLFLCITLVGCRLNHTTTKPNTIGVFGDDIICPADSADKVISLLALFGFTTNNEKTFTKGPFRESCGEDFFLGAPVRPFFLKKEIKHYAQLYTMANGIRLCSVRSLLGVGSDVRFRDFWESVVKQIPPEYRFAGSSDLGDTHIWANPSDNDQLELQFATYTGGYWRGKRLVSIQREINFAGYQAATPLNGWFIMKEGKLGYVYEKDKQPLSDKWFTSHHIHISRLAEYLMKAPGPRIDGRATLLPRTFRANTEYTVRYRLGKTALLAKTDCPPYV